MFQIYIFSILGHEKKKNIRKANNLALGSYSQQTQNNYHGLPLYELLPSKEGCRMYMSHILEDSSSIMTHLGYT